MMTLSHLEQKLCDQIDESTPSAIALLSDLVGFNSQLGNEQAAQDYMAQYFLKLGLDVDRFEVEPDLIKQMPGYSPPMIDYKSRENIVATHHPIDSHHQARSLILNGHIDVVPTGPIERWVSDPFCARVEDDKLFARGSGDMKAGITAYCIAYQVIREMGYSPNSPIYFQSVIEEECTGNGALACLQRGYRADAAIIPEPFAQTMMIAQLGVMWLTLKVSGLPAHVLDTSTGVNAIEAGFKIYEHLKVLENEWNKAQNRDQHYLEHNHPINFNLGKIAGGDWSSTVPTECEMNIRIGFYPSMSLDEAKSHVETVISKAVAEFAQNGVEIKADVTYKGFQAQGFSANDQLPLFEELSQVHQSVSGNRIEKMASTATTDARFFHLYGDIPATCYGPVAGDYHSFNEWVSISSMMEVTKVLAIFINRWCGLRKI